MTMCKVLAYGKMSSMSNGAASRTARYDEVEARLGRPLADYVAAFRSAGASWRRIALEIHADTGVDLTGESLRIWFAAHHLPTCACGATSLSPA